MNVYTPRTTAPAEDNPDWIGSAYGGMNDCLVINKTTGSVLPNCVGYAWGRWVELLGKKPNLCRGNAKEWYGFWDGYSRGQLPALGAVACWGPIGSYKYGHVAIVEALGDGYVMLSQSNYGEERFEYKKALRMANGKYQSPKGNTNFQGFIYIPIRYEAVGSGTPVSGPYKSVDDIARAIIKGTGVWYKCYGSARRKKIESYGFNPDQVQKRVNEILAGGK